VLTEVARVSYCGSMMRRALALCVPLSLVLAACANPLYSPCNGQADCASDLRCIDLGNNQRLCTKPCSVQKDAAGYPDGFDDDELFVDGSGAQSSVAEPECADEAVTVTSQDNPDEAAQNILVESAGVVGVCQVAPSLLQDDAISGDSVLVGFCAPR
jgi:hypothetical protein